MKVETQNSGPVASDVKAGREDVATVRAAHGRSEGLPLGRVLDLVKWAFSFPVMLATGLVGAVFAASRAFLVDPDVWWHIKVGQAILATHHLPTTDIYSFTASGQPWITPEWLGEVLLASVFRVAGVRGLYVLLVVLGSAIILGLCRLATIRSGNSKAGIAAAAALLLLAYTCYSVRPQMMGYVFLIVTMIALEMFRRGRKWALWVLPPLFLVWVNTHGSWIIGLGALFVYWVCGLWEFRLGSIEAKRWSANERGRISLAFVLCFIAVMVTPYGTKLAGIPFRFAFGLPLNTAGIEEWLPMPFNLPIGKIFLVLVLGFFLAQMALGLRWRLAELVLLFGGTVMACLHARFVLIFVSFFAPALAVVLAQWLSPYSRAKDKYILNAILMASVVAGMVRYFPSQAELEQKVAERFPVKAVEYLRSHAVPRPMFNAYFFGGYLVDALGPQQKVFIDGRGELYEPSGVFNDYLRVTNLAPDGLDVLRRYGIQSCLLQRNEPLASVLAALPEWREVYSDETSALFVRRDK